MVKKVKYVKNLYKSCVLCRLWISEGVAVGHFDVVCLDCVERLAAALPEAVEQGVKAENSIEQQTVITCKECGETFTNRGKFLAHCRAHKREES